MAVWHMLTLVGADKPGIVAKITKALYEVDCNLGEASMNCLGNSFTIMVMVNSDKSASEIEQAIKPICASLELHYHLDAIEGKLHNHRNPDTIVTVSGADHAGIVAKVTSALFESGLNIIDLNSEVAGTEAKPIYIMQIEGQALNGIEPIEAAIASFKDQNIDVRVESIDTMIG